MKKYVFMMILFICVILYNGVCYGKSDIIDYDLFFEDGENTDKTLKTIELNWGEEITIEYKCQGSIQGKPNKEEIQHELNTAGSNFCEVNINEEERKINLKANKIGVTGEETIVFNTRVETTSSYSTSYLNIIVKLKNKNEFTFEDGKNEKNIVLAVGEKKEVNVEITQNGQKKAFVGEEEFNEEGYYIKRDENKFTITGKKVGQYTFTKMFEDKSITFKIKVVEEGLVYDDKDVESEKYEEYDFCYEIRFEDGSTKKTINVPKGGSVKVNVVVKKNGKKDNKLLKDYNMGLTTMINNYYTIERENNTFTIYRKRNRDVRKHI